MTTPFRTLQTFSLPLWLLAAIGAQSPALEVPHARAGSLPDDRIVFDRAEDGTLWAVARTYKMSFAHGAATYVPFFGSTSPRDFPIVFSVQHVAADGTDVQLTSAAPEQHGTRVTTNCGVLSETWDLTSAGAEQHFVFATRPGAGNLVVTVGVATDLAMNPADDGILFVNEHGSVHYSQAVLVDAAGRRTPVATRPFDHRIEIEVPAAVLDAAQFPVVVDPLVQTTVVSGTGAYEHAIDSAYDATHNQWVVCFESDFSATDHDVGSYLLNFDGTVVPGSFQWIDYTTDSWIDPRIASHRLYGYCLVVAQRLLPAPSEIWGRIRVGGSNNMGSQYQISQNGGSHPDVGGDNSTTLGISFQVVWHRDDITQATIVGRQVSFLGAPNGSEIVLGSGVINISFPAISKSCGITSSLGQAWPVVWPVPAQSAAPHLIRGVLVNVTGVPIGYQADWFSHPSQAMQRPSVSSLTDPIRNQRYFMVAWQQDHGGFFELFAGVRSLGGPAVAATNVGTLVGFGNTYTQTPVVDSFGSRFALAFATSFLFFPYDIVAATLDLPSTATGLAIGVVESYAWLSSSSTTAPNNLNPRICSAHSGGGSEPTIRPRYFVGWERSGDVIGATYDAHAPTGGYTVLPTACGAFGIQGTGVPHAGGYITGSLVYAGPDPTFVLVGLPPPAPITLCPPNCRLGIDPAVVFSSFGPQISFAVPPTGGFAGFVLAVQGASLGPWSCIGPLIFSDTLHVVLQ